MWNISIIVEISIRQRCSRGHGNLPGVLRGRPLGYFLAKALVQGMGFSFLKKGGCRWSGKAGCGLGPGGTAVLGKEAETESQTHTGSPPVRRKRDCGLEVRASLRLTEAPWMAYRAESLQLWLGLLKSCPRRGWACQEGLSWGAGKADRKSVV